MGKNTVIKYVIDPGVVSFKKEDIGEGERTIIFVREILCKNTVVSW